MFAVIVVFRRESWDKFSTFNCWSQLLEITRKQSHDHGILAEICNNQVISRLTEVLDNSQRIFRKVRKSIPLGRRPLGRTKECVY